MKKQFLKKGLSVITAAAMVFSLMTGTPFRPLDMSITASAAAAALDLTGFDYDVTTSSPGWYYNKVNRTLTIDSGYEFTLTGGTFTEKVANNGTILNGSFSGIVTNVEYNGTISGGTFSGTVNNERGCEISGGEFTNSSTVNNEPVGDITGGVFYGTVNNKSALSGDHIVNGLISGGTYEDYAVVNNNGLIQNGTFKSNSKINNSGTITALIPNGVITCTGSHTVGTPATCQSKAICALCGNTYGDFAPHDFVDGECVNCYTFAKVMYSRNNTIYYTDDFISAVTDINSNGGGTITLRGDIACTPTEDIKVKQNLTLDLGTYTLGLDIYTLEFTNGITASVIGTGEITSIYTGPDTGEAVYVSGGSSLTIGTENGNGPTITGGANSISTADSGANKLTVYSGTFNGTCHFDSSGDYNISIRGGTFNSPVYTDWTIIDGGVFNEEVNCANGSHLIINNCECAKPLKIGQQNTSTRYVTLNGGKYALGIENQTSDGKTTDFLGADRYYIDQYGQIIEIDNAADTGYDINQYVIIAPLRTVTFETNNYGGEDFEKKTADGFTVDEPAALTDADAIFGGWYKDAALSTLWNFAADTVTDNITIYAKWTEREKTAAPVFSPASGTAFDEQLAVTITCATEGAEIFYTTDGTTPTALSTKYTGAIALTDSTAIKAIAVKTGMKDSEIASAEYTKKAVITTNPPTVITTPQITSPSIVITSPSIVITTPAVTTTTVTTTTTTAVTTTTVTTTTTAVTTTTAPATEELPPETTEKTDEEPVRTDDNPPTGVAVGFAGIAASAAAAVITRKRKNK